MNFGKHTPRNLDRNGLDQHEHDAAHGVRRRIAPKVVRRPLHDNVAGVQADDGTAVQFQFELTRQYDAIVDGPAPVRNAKRCRMKITVFPCWSALWMSEIGRAHV